MALGLPANLRFDITARDRSGPAWRGVENSIQRTQRSLGAFIRAAGPLLGLGGVAVSGTALAFATRDALEFADALVLAADRTSFTVEELESLRYAGRLNRVQFTQTDMALQRFSRRLAEAANGTGELRNDLEGLGIPLRDASGQMRSSYEILLDFADAVANAESEQEQLRLSFKAFDSEGASFIAAIRNGADGLREYRREAEDANAIMGDELARSAAEAATAFERMNLQITSERNQAIAEHAEGLENLAVALGDIARLGIHAAAAIGNLYANLADGQTEEDVLRGLELILDGNRDRLADLRARVNDYAEVLSDPTASRGQIQFARSRAQEAEEEIPILERRIQRLEQRLSFRSWISDGLEEPEPEEGARPPSSPETLQQRLDREKGTGKPRGDATATGLDDKLERDEALEREMERKRELTMDLMREEGEARVRELERHRGDFVNEFAHSFAGGIEAAFDGDLQEFIARRLRQAAYRGLYDAFAQLGGDLFDHFGGGGKGGGLSAILSGGSNLLFGGKKAAGGPVEPGKFYQWQDRGQEFFAPQVPGSVLRADQMGGVTNIHNHFHLHAEGAVMTDELLQQMDEKAAAAQRGAIETFRLGAALDQRHSSRALGLPR